MSKRKRHPARWAWCLIPAAMVACNSDSNTISCPITGPLNVQLAAQARHIPEIVQSLSDEGEIPAAETSANPLTLTVALALNHEDELDQRLAEMYQPGHPNFHRFMTPMEFRSRYAPTRMQVEAAREFLESRGFRVDSTETGLFLHAHGTMSSAEGAFDVRIHRYHDEKGNSYFAPGEEPRLPTELSIQAVHGLHNLGRLRSLARPAANAEATPDYTSGASGMNPAQIRSTYQVPSTVSGAGQTLALVELDGFYASDVTAYQQAFGLSGGSVQPVLLDGYNGTPGTGAAEVTLDVELAMAVAPGARILVYEAPDSAQSLLDIYERIASDNSASQVSISWGAPESEMGTAFLQSENVILKQMAAQGQSVYVASGDSGAYDNGSSLSVSDPASQPFVVAVGGTRLSSVDGTYASETTWNDGNVQAGAGGGGISAAWAQPSWQSGVASAQNGASTTMRNVPDVSLNADPSVGYAVFFQGAWTMFGGTSCATPIWAAFTALVNQQRTSTGLGALGFPNPALYAIGKGSRGSQDFHDVADGSNNLFYPAVPGFDDATGWGSFNGASLFEDLSTVPSASGSGLSC